MGILVEHNEVEQELVEIDNDIENEQAIKDGNLAV